MREIKMSANGWDVALIENGKEVWRITREQYKILSDEEKGDLFEVLVNWRKLDFKGIEKSE